MKMIQEKSDYDDDDDSTYLDSIFTHLREKYKNCKNIATIVIQKLQKFLQIEEYDTDSVSMDVSHDGENGNISKHIKNESCIDSIIGFVASSPSMLFYVTSGSFPI